MSFSIARLEVIIRKRRYRNTSTQWRGSTFSILICSSLPAQYISTRLSWRFKSAPSIFPFILLRFSSSIKLFAPIVTNPEFSIVFPFFSPQVFLSLHVKLCVYRQAQVFCVCVCVSVCVITSPWVSGRVTVSYGYKYNHPGLYTLRE